MNEYEFDVCVIGGGIAGLTAVSNALEKNFSVAFFEQNIFGGKSFNGGDYFLNNIFEEVKSEHYKDSFKLNDLLHKTNMVKNDLLGHYFPFLKEHKNLKIFKDKATIINPNLVTSNNVNCHCKNIIIATGAKHNIVDIDGIDEAIKNNIAFYSINLDKIKPNSKKIAVIGGGRVALEIAMILSEFKIQTHVYSRSGILSHLDQEVKEVYLDLVKNKHLFIHTNTNFNKIEGHTLYFNNTSSTFDHFILASGFFFDNKILENLTIDQNEEGILVNDFMQTSIKNIYAIGDTNTNPRFSKVAINEAIVAVSHINGFRTPIKGKIFHRILGKYEYSYIGKNEKQLINKNISYSKLIFTENDLPDHHDKIKFVKVLINNTTREILGIFVIAKDAFTLINSLNLLLEETIEDKINSRLPLFTNTYYISRKIEEKLKQMDLNIINNYYEPFYQVKVNKDRKIVGAESLARFKQNDKFLFPLPFIENFENSGLIIDFDLKAINYAAKFINELKELDLIDDNFKLSVNLSSFTVDTINYNEITNILDKHNINYEQILFEITERTTTEDKTFKEKLAKFKSLGLYLSMDDFSVGNSSIQLFYDVNFAEIKLDMALLPKDENDLLKTAIYSNLSNLIKGKNNHLTSEGVEDEFHFNFTKDLGVDFYQGYYFSKPVSKDDLIQLLKEKKENNYIL